MTSLQKPGPHSLCVLVSLVAVFFGGGNAVHADPTEAFAVLVTASVQESPATITLNWEQDADTNANPSYTVYRKAINDVSWGAGTALGNVLTYVDSNVTVGSAYEYQIVKTTTLGYSGYGYIYAGIRATTVPDARGKLILVVDNTFTTSLAPELARLERDLAGDGWSVIRHDVVRDDESIPAADLENLGFGSAANQANAASIRNTIIADYNADPGNVKAVLLFGRIPIFRAGNNDVDGHLPRPMPADGFYGEMDGTWTTATSSLPSDVELQVGRVDLSRMTGKAVWNGPDTFPSELELLRQYLNKDHNFRHGVIEVERRAIVGEGFGEAGGEAFGASGWRNFTPFFGASSITRAEINTSPSWQELVCDTANAGTTYLWAEGDGAGSPSGMGALGTHGQYNRVWTRDLVGIAENGSRTPDIKAVFTILFGSWFGEWDRTDDFMRGVLASRTMGLTASWSGIPHHFYHHMGLGETIGYGMRLSQNNDGTNYKNHVQTYTRGIHVALMGDPTLRMHVVKPPTDVTASGTGTIALDWTASTDSALQGYHVYRSTGASGPFTKLSASPVASTTYADTPASSGTYTYMVRAVKLESSSSGTYLNLSQGIFVTASTTGGGTGNTAPDVSAGTDLSVERSGLASLAGSVSDDGLPGVPASTSLTWRKISGPGAVYFTDVNSSVPQASFSAIGTYTLRLTGNDGAAVASDDVVVTVTPPTNNQAPAVSAGADQTITLPSGASLSGSVTDDAIPGPTSSVWSTVSGPGTVTFADPSAPTTTATFSTDGVYVLRLTGNDGALSSSDDVVLTVDPAPIAPPGTGLEFAVDANTIALYHFNGDYADASGNGYDLTATGATARNNANLGWMKTPAGEVARFADLGDTLTVSIPDAALMASAASVISVEARIYIRNYRTDYTTPNAEILTLYQDYDSQITIRDSKYHSPSGPNVFGSDQTVAVTSSEWTGGIATGSWHDLLITLDAGDMLTCYIDGTQIGSSVSAPPNVNRPENWNLTLGNFDGDIDEVRVSNVVRTPVQPVTTFDGWQSLNFTPAEMLDPQVSDPDADPDNDELSNLLEYALALDPRKPSDNGVVLSKQVVDSKTYLHLQYTRFGEATDLTFEPQTSSGLDHWSGGDIVEITSFTNPDETRTVIVRDAIAIDDAPRRFIRLNVYWGDLD